MTDKFKQKTSANRAWQCTTNPVAVYYNHRGSTLQSPWQCTTITVAVKEGVRKRVLYVHVKPKRNTILATIASEADGTIVSQPTDSGIQVAVGKAGGLFQLLITPLTIITKGGEHKVSIAENSHSIHEFKSFSLWVWQISLGI